MLVGEETYEWMFQREEVEFYLGSFAFVLYFTEYSSLTQLSVEPNLLNKSSVEIEMNTFDPLTFFDDPAPARAASSTMLTQRNPLRDVSAFHPNHKLQRPDTLFLANTVIKSSYPIAGFKLPLKNKSVIDPLASFSLPFAIIHSHMLCIDTQTLVVSTLGKLVFLEHFGDDNRGEALED